MHRYTREIPEPAPSLYRHGAQIGGLRVFPVIKITMVHQVHMSPASTAVWAWTCVKLRTASKDSGCICFTFAFAWVVGKNMKTSNLSPMADDTITRGGIRGLGSPLYICGVLSCLGLCKDMCTNTHHHICTNWIPKKLSQPGWEFRSESENRFA